MQECQFTGGFHDQRCELDVECSAGRVAEVGLERRLVAIRLIDEEVSRAPQRWLASNNTLPGSWRTTSEYSARSPATRSSSPARAVKVACKMTAKWGSRVARSWCADETPGQCPVAIRAGHRTDGTAAARECNLGL